MDLMHYLSSKPIRAYFCPHCFDWHWTSGELTIAEFFKEGKGNCNDGHTKKYSSVPEKATIFHWPIWRYYNIKCENRTVYFSGYLDREFPTPCLGMAHTIEGQISIQDIATNSFHSEIRGNYLDIFFDVDCHPLYCCSECGIYGKEEYFYKCRSFASIMEENVLYHHEDNVRAHFNVLLGFRYEIKEGDPIFNAEKLRRLYNKCKKKLFVLKENIPALAKSIYMLQKYVLKDSDELQTLDSVNNELKELLREIEKLNRKISATYGESEDNIFSKEYNENGEISIQYMSELLRPRIELDYKMMYPFYKKKEREYIEQKAAESIPVFEGFQTSISSIESKVNKISEKLRRLFSERYMKF